MSVPAPTRIRNLAASLMTISGIGHVAALWFRELTMANLLAALVGFVYIIIGIGLFGQSRFTLFVAMAIPTTASFLLLRHHGIEQLHDLQLAGLATNALVFAISAIVLWQVRHNPSV